MNNTIGSFEAKTHLSQLLEKVQEGVEITITKRGKPIARLIPVKEDKSKTNMDVILKGFDSIRNRVKGEIDIKSIIMEGRKH